MPVPYTPKDTLMKWADDLVPRYNFVGNWHLQPAVSIRKRLQKLVTEQRTMPEHTGRDREIENCREALWAKEARHAA